MSYQDSTLKGRVSYVKKGKETVFLKVDSIDGEIYSSIDRKYFDNSPLKVGDIIKGNGSQIETFNANINFRFEDYELLVRPTNNSSSNVSKRDLVSSWSKLEKTTSSFFEESGAVRVNTNILSKYYGTSDIIPFKTTHKKKDYFLRFTMELALRKLSSQTQLPLFEIGSVFRNMGKSSNRSLEYRSCEAFIPYMDFEEGVKISKELLKKVSRSFNLELPELPETNVSSMLSEKFGDFSASEALKEEFYRESLKKGGISQIVMLPPSNWSSPLYQIDQDNNSKEARFIYEGLGTIIQVSQGSTDINLIINSLNNQKKG